MSEKRITIYGQPSCPYCTRAKALCEGASYPYVSYDIRAEPERRSELLRKAPDAKTVPQIFIGRRHIGGFEELQKAHAAGRVAAWLK